MGIVFTTILLIATLAGYVVYEKLNLVADNDYETAGDGVVQLVEIVPGSSVSQLGPSLVERDIVKSNKAFQAAAAANPKAANVTPGFYRLQGQMRAKDAVEALLDPANKVELLRVPNGATLFDVTVVGGSTRPGIYSQIADVACGAAPDSNCVTVAKLQQAAISTDPAALGVPSWAIEQVIARGEDPRRLEGLIAPGEYVIDPTMDATSILTKLLTQSTKTWDNTGIVAKAQATGLTPYQLLTAASILERESPASEFGKVARVIVNRLSINMRLEMDSTVNYGLADQEVATTDEDRGRATPWNTYAKEGLPDTPIASPSIAAVEAMEDPTPGNWTFFATIDKEGTTVFTDNFDEHLENSRKAAEAGVLDSNR